LVNGVFTPSEEAKSLTIAPHFNNSSTPVLARFSNSTGIPEIPDSDPNANPRGFGVRFELPSKNGRRVHTDIIGHSVNAFPVRTGADFGEFLKALGGSPPGTPSPTPVEKFLGSHPAALAFVQAPKPFPESFATEEYYALNAFKLIDSNGKGTYVRYRWIPDAGTHTLNEETVKAKGANYHFEELPNRLKKGPVGFKLLAQVAEEGDPTDDITAKWPDSRKFVELGALKLESIAEDNAATQKHTILDPIPRVEGIEASADPILEFRAAVYLLSGRERRAA
jgi:catalase